MRVRVLVCVCCLLCILNVFVLFTFEACYAMFQSRRCCLEAFCNNDVNIQTVGVRLLEREEPVKPPVGGGFVCEGGAVTWVQIAANRNFGQKYFLKS